ncbi:terminase B [Fuchsiella alkaliacetigena]|uniref:terminase B n=1 Tax=Fuchsiella alkaliacetigena TaxID=957042 RepID=UPI00200B640E|nr:terminase B [Fuchsiella alkaliacetigena]MCK8824720.1 terminase B [Fuchsiella alkaliacetigena]
MTNEPDWEELSYFYYDKPVEFVEDIIGQEPTDQQAKLLNSVLENRATSAKAGHGVGKTAGEAWVVLWFMFTRAMCRIPCTAPTGHQLNDILWPEIKKWYNQSKLKEHELFLWTKTRFAFNDEEYKDMWFATPRSSNKPDNMQGFHADEVLYIVDEASGVDQEVMEVIEGALTNDGARLLMCGNPTQISGMFYDSHKKDRDFFNCLTFSCEDSPLVSQEYIDRIYDRYGYHSNVARVRVRGQFPTQEPDTIIPITLPEKAAMTEIDPEGRVVHIGVDVARYGDDETVFYSRRGGKNLDYEIKQQTSTTDTSGFAAALAKKYNSQYQVKIKVDVTGVGGGVVDELKAKSLNNTIIIPVGFGEKAAENDKYANKVTEMYFLAKEYLKENPNQIPNDEELIAQLSSRKYSIDSKDRFRIESKDDFKKRTGQSPDRADGFVLSYYEAKRKTAGTW